MFRAYHALPPLTTSRGLPTGAVYGLCTMLQKLEREYPPSHLLVVFDAPGPNFRHEIFTGYKADRPPMPPDLAKQIEIVHRVVSVFQIPTLSIPDVEADDVIATLAVRAAREGHKVIIASSDKDLMQLCSQDIQLLDTMRGRLLGPAEVEEKFGVPPHLVGDVLALMGDGIDNVPGVEGIGPKTAADLIRRYGTLEGLLEHSGEVKGKRGEALRASHEMVRVSRRLVDLKCDVPLPLPTEAYRRGTPDLAARYALFRELEFFRLIPQDSSINLISAPPPPPPKAPVQASLVFDAPPPVVPAAEPVSTLASDDAPADADDFTEMASAPAVDLPPAAPAPSSPVAIVRDNAALTALIEQIKASGACAIGVLSEGREATRAAFVGFGFALRDGSRHYLPVGHLVLGEPTTLRAPEALQFLAPLFADATVDKVVHDGKFLEVMLAQRSLAIAGIGHDVMLGAYILDASRSRYDLDILAGALGLHDVTPRAALLGSGKSARAPSQIPIDVAANQLGAEAAAILAIADFQRAALKDTGLDRLCDGLERPLARVLAKMESEGILLDVSELGRLGTELSTGIVALEKEIHALAGTEFNIGSPKQLAEVLFGKLGLPVIRRTKTGPSTDADVLEALAAEHPVPAKIVEFRGLTKLKNTYVDALPLLVHPRTGRLHTTFNQAVAATGRLSSSEPNLQNIPIRTELGRRIRQAFVADPGHQLVSADYSQIELRILAHFSEDPAFLEAFRAGQDIHQRTAAEVFGVPLET
ncbi:MAG TPA: DNA polymerase I, partial [Polyangia bacterium]